MHLIAWYDTCMQGHVDLQAALLAGTDPVILREHRLAIDQPTGVDDQAAVEGRQDVLDHTSARLAEPLGQNGPLSVTLYASSSAPDTDFTAKLADVETDGYCDNIAEDARKAVQPVFHGAQHPSRLSLPMGG